MPRRKRSAYAAKSTIGDLSPQQQADMVTWRTTDTQRFWCPLCGMVADVERVLDAPYQLRSAVQRYGGSLPGYNENGKRNGYMQYFEDPELGDEVRDLAAQLLPAVDEIRVYLRDLAGDRVDTVEPITSTRLPAYRPPDRFDEDDIEPDDFDDDFDDGLDEDEEDRLRQQARDNVQRRIGPAPTRIALPPSRSAQRQITGRPAQKQITGKTGQKALPPPRE